MGEVIIALAVLCKSHPLTTMEFKRENYMRTEQKCIAKHLACIRDLNSKSKRLALAVQECFEKGAQDAE